MKTLFGACAALAVCAALSACGDDYQGGGRQKTLPGRATPEADAGADPGGHSGDEAEPHEDGGES